MGVRVRIPVSLRLPRGLAPEDLAKLEVATGNALAGAFRRARREIVDPRGRWRRVRIEPTRFAFAGERVPEDERGRIEDAVARGIDLARTALGGAELVRAEPIGVGAPPQEPRDRDRWDPRLGTYRMPFFDTRVPGFVAAPTDPAAGEHVYPTVDEVRRWLGTAYDPYSNPHPGYYGTILGFGASPVLLFVASPDEVRWFRFVRWDLKRRVWVDHRREDLAEGGEYVLEQTAERVTAASLEAWARERKRELSREESADLAHRIEATHAWWRLMHASSRALIERLVVDRGFSASPLLLRAGAIAAPGERVEEGGTGGTAAEAREGAGGEGAGAGTGEGAGGVGIEGGTGRALVWPSVGGGMPLVCAPFRGEPCLDELRHGADELRIRIERLARLLHLETCDYAGHFCIEAARIVGARAHDVGIAAIRAGDVNRVTVHPSGTGNHGVVDIQPAESTALLYMKLVATAVRMVAELAASITHVYLDRRNRSLPGDAVRDEPRLEPSTWGLRFFEQYVDVFLPSCRILFAETCRVILLQQLRATKEFIAERRGETHFAESVQRFEASLGVMGETIGALQELKDRLRRARILASTPPVPIAASGSPAGQLMGLGQAAIALLGPATQADLLAEFSEHPEAAAALAFGGGVTVVARVLPAPLQRRLAGARVEREGDAFVAYWEDRRWTDTDLDAAIQMRRAVLNVVDPLFVQVSDVEELHRSFAFGRTDVKRYLFDLLDEMDRANAEVTKKTSDHDDGMYFAVDTSRFVVAKGGVSSRGMRYEMHGMHQLADDQLRPFAGDVVPYRRGVEGAIGRREARETISSLGITLGIVVLGVICAPLGAVAAGAIVGAASIAVTVHEYLGAKEGEELYRALKDPEKLVTWQEVQAEYMMVAISGAFTVFDVIAVGRALRAAARPALQAVRGGLGSVKSGLRAGLREGGKAAAEGAVKRSIAELGAEMLEKVLWHGAAALASDAVLGRVFNAVLEPILTPILERIGREHGSGVDLAALLSPAEPDPRDEADALEIAAELEPNGAAPGAGDAP